tara:strand:+ start:374 stop:1156 length:783 start_codon:yes stop_codon:yes gene_type:complete
MKIGIIQGLESSNISDYELKHFWQPCIDSVRDWAERRGYGYHLYRSPLLPKTQTALDVTWLGDSERTEIWFNKFAWMKDQAPNYDMLCWIDADIFVWGDPRDIFHHRLYHEEKFSVLYRSSTILPLENSWKRLHLGMFWASRALIAETADWMNSMIFNPEQRSALFTTFLMCCQQLGIDFYDEIAFSVWYHENKDRCLLIKVESTSDDNDWYVIPKKLGYTMHKDTFNHFTGGDKFRDKQRFDAYRAYLAYDKGRNIWIK